MAGPEHTRLSDLTWRNMMHPKKRCHKGENNKRATRMCTRHPGGHNLAKLIRAPSNESVRPECAWSGTLTRRDMARLPKRSPSPKTCLPERTHMGENGKRATRTCIRHPGDHNLSNLTQVPSAQTTRPEQTPSLDATRRARPEWKHMGANGKRAAQTCTRHPGSHKLENMTSAPSGQMARPERTPSTGATWGAQPNGHTWEQRENGLPEHAQGT